MPVRPLPPDQSRWLEHEAVERTRREVDLPMTHVIIDLGADHAESPAASATRISSA